MAAATEKRNRTPRACIECKSSKKRCDGDQPCGRCIQKGLLCSFFAPEPATATNVIYNQNDHNGNGHISKKRRQFPPRTESDTLPPNIAQDGANGLGREDEAPIYDSSRMLQDQTGRLLYLGDSASLSFLQTMRRVVSNSRGISSFTEDIHRHEILEAASPGQGRVQRTCALPDQETSFWLIDSFFAGTVGLFDFLDQYDFRQRVIKTYENPMAADHTWLSQLNLVFAVGVQLRTQNQGSSMLENQIFERLRAGQEHVGEMFFLNSKSLDDQACGLEDGELVSVQSLLLVTIYMLTAAKRNAAWAYFGMAVRLAYALGIHKEETHCVFRPEDQVLRRNTWRSLYIMDCYLSASLGRPIAISLDDAPVLPTDDKIGHQQQTGASLSNIAIMASVRASKLTGEILTRIYPSRHISRSTAHEIATKFQQWTQELPPQLRWQEITVPYEEKNMPLTQLHVNLIYFHSIILLTRPFLLLQINLQLNEEERLASGTATTARDDPSTRKSTIEKNKSFSGACGKGAVYTINAVQATFLKGALPRQDPFVIYWLFSAALIVLSNAFCPVYTDVDTKTAQQSAMSLLRSFSSVDKQAKRYLNILESFHDATRPKDQRGRDPTRTQKFDIIQTFFGCSNPMPSISSSETYADISTGNGMPLNTMIADPVNMIGVSDGLMFDDDIIDLDGLWWPEDMSHISM